MEREDTFPFLLVVFLLVLRVVAELVAVVVVSMIRFPFFDARIVQGNHSPGQVTLEHELEIIARELFLIRVLFLIQIKRGISRVICTNMPTNQTNIITIHGDVIQNKYHFFFTDFDV